MKATKCSESSARKGKMEHIMTRIDELYLARVEAESVEQAAFEALQSEPADEALQRAHRDAERAAEAAGAAYLDALLEEERLRHEPLASV